MNMTFDGPKEQIRSLPALRSAATPNEAARALQATQSASWLRPLSMETVLRHKEVAFIHLQLLQKL